MHAARSVSADTAAAVLIRERGDDRVVTIERVVLVSKRSLLKRGRRHPPVPSRVIALDTEQ